MDSSYSEGGGVSQALGGSKACPCGARNWNHLPESTVNIIDPVAFTNNIKKII